MENVVNDATRKLLIFTLKKLTYLEKVCNQEFVNKRRKKNNQKK